MEGLNPPTTSPLATGLALPRGSDSVRSASFQIFAFRTLLHSAGGITLGISRGGVFPGDNVSMDVISYIIMFVMQHSRDT